MSPTAQEVVEEAIEQQPIPEAKKWAAETLGTFILVMGGVGTAVLAGDKVGALGVALAFGLTLMFLVYAIGPISGCHVNPAVTIGQLLMGRLSTVSAVGYIISQLIGAFLSGLVLFAIAKNLPAYDRAVDGLGANGWGEHSPSAVTGPLGQVVVQDGYGMAAMIIVEVMLTALLVFVVLASTDQISDVPLAGLSIGVTLAAIHLISIPVDNTSVNPARSLGVAPYQDGAMAQSWAFVVFPLIGGCLGALIYGMLFGRSRDMIS
ncbi:AraC family transcriptional regulator [Nocardia cyriacigeorgica]|uniref:AraC family transcriptional regulator n=1 Tax=Nocardia cyriacigeorgica TaxID=135487 RepID=A0A6P1D954_9NOCA|nr:aquaporin [Nocardia cyriacigeorgica]NEW42368.1 AraC family transcriptional regulator [Nocardia cyriacigeorgica]NEW46071.1 AraC family transcriptional regulator [Nocardia cyriacigeorgica]NEW53264.1 AraC family transcriptional regulator [Nocardia cyriacigeorgica]NEW57826.1 AraC family transcriptional regulator [Nocardia cyriacigeorgica]